MERSEQTTLIAEQVSSAEREPARRGPLLHVDGSRIFVSPDDLRREAEVAREVAKRWKCLVKRFPTMCGVDWYCERYERMIGVAELKDRNCTSTKFPTEMLEAKKYINLTHASLAFCVPPVFIVRHTDGVIRWVNVWEVDARHPRLGGAEENRQMMIHIPNEQFHLLEPL